MPNDKLNFKVYRFDPAQDKKPQYKEYTIPHYEGMRVLDALIYVYEEMDHSLSFRHSCKIENCQICQVKIDGKTALACTERARDGMVIEPISRYKHVRDLVVDYEEKFEQSDMAKKQFDQD